MPRKKYPYQHKQVKVKYGDRFITVDEKIKPLLEALWDRGIDTLNSCQENRPGVAWIEFMTAADAEEFLNLAHELGDEDMKLRIEMGGWGDDWEYDAIPDLFDEMGFHIAISVRFPVYDMEYLTKKLTRKGIDHEVSKE